MKKFVKFLVGILVFLILVETALNFSFLFGALFIFGVVYAIVTGELSERPFLPILIFLGSLITHYALLSLLGSVVGAKTYVDLGVGILMFLVIFLIGRKVKRQKRKIKVTKKGKVRVIKKRK